MAVPAGHRTRRIGPDFPYHESCRHRCADRRFPQLAATVDRQVMCSSLLQSQQRVTDDLRWDGRAARRPAGVRFEADKPTTRILPSWSRRLARTTRCEVGLGQLAPTIETSEIAVLSWSGS